jgi:N-acyl-D-amino-acid deacylase
LSIIFCATTTIEAQFPDLKPQTPLLDALVHNDKPRTLQLLEGGTDPNQADFVGFSPLELAVIRGDLQLVRLMTQKGAAINFKDGSGSTPLMWATFNETGDARLVDELLKLGANPFVTNKAGETALTWALRRGETPAVAALRNAGLYETDSIRKAVQKSLPLLQKSGDQFTRVSGCFSCHHQTLPQMAFATARARGFALDEAGARQQADSIAAVLKSVVDQARNNRDRIPDVPITVSYALVALAAAEHQRDETIATMAQMVGAWQGEDGAFSPIPPIRPPIESSQFTATALSVRALQAYGDHPEEKIAAARQWLMCAKPATNEDRAMQALGLVWTKAPEDAIRKSAQAIISEQRPDGGWAQVATLESDAYATGQALVALEESGIPTESVAYRRGVGFLMRTQFADGSWLVRSRTFPIQPLKESGFPHGKDQWISAAGTSWAVMALSMALPVQSRDAEPLTRQNGSTKGGA